MSLLKALHMGAKILESGKEGLGYDDDLCWKTASEGLVSVIEMTDEHLQNTIKMLVETRRVESRGAYHRNGTQFAVWSRDKWADVLCTEARERGL